MPPGLAQRFSHRLRVRYSDCDPQGVVFFANHAMFFDVGMTELWREAIAPYDEMVQGGVDMVVAECTVRYWAPLRFDDEADISIAVTRLGTTGMSTAVEISIGDTLCSEGELRHVFIDTATKSKTAIPEEIRNGLQPYLSG